MAIGKKPGSTAWRRTIDSFHRQIVHRYLTRGEAHSDREIAHERAIALAEKLQNNPLALALLRQLFVYRDPILETKLGILRAPNPLGIAAGFDKNARIAGLLGEGLGFGIVTVGSITKIPYEGNKRPRIFDLPNNDGLINRMGFPGEGADEATKRLSRLPLRRDRNYLLKVSVAASKPSFTKERAIKDYCLAYERVLHHADIIEVNVSSPNTAGVRGLQEPEVFAELATQIQEIREKSPFAHVPLVYKFGPDLPPVKLETDLTIAKDHGADGVTLTNTSTDEELRGGLQPDDYAQETGGMSGAFLGPKSLETTNRAYKHLGDTMFIVRAGGVRGTAEDLWEALTYGGATAAEVYSSFVRPTTSTPNFSYYALAGLARAMRTEGMASMADFKDLRGKRVKFPLS